MKYLSILHGFVSGTLVGHLRDACLEILRCLPKFGNFRILKNYDDRSLRGDELSTKKVTPRSCNSKREDQIFTIFFPKEFLHHPVKLTFSHLKMGWLEGDFRCKLPNFRLSYREVSTLEDSTTTLEYGFAEVSGSQGSADAWVVFFVHVV